MTTVDDEIATTNWHHRYIHRVFEHWSLFHPQFSHFLSQLGFEQIQSEKDQPEQMLEGLSIDFSVLTSSSKHAPQTNNHRQPVLAIVSIREHRSDLGQRLFILSDSPISFAHHDSEQIHSILLKIIHDFLDHDSVKPFEITDDGSISSWRSFLRQHQEETNAETDLRAKFTLEPDGRLVVDTWFLRS